MENKDLQILAEMSELAAALRSQLDELENMICQLKAEHEESVGCQCDIEDAPIDIDIDDITMEEFDEVVNVVEPEPVETMDEVPVVQAFAPVAEDESVFEPVKETVVEHVTEPVAQIKADEVPVRQAVIDVLEDKRAWKTDMPGAPVRDIRSAISLNDRVLFINRLFNEDPLSFQEMLSKINNMTSLSEVIEAVVTEHPDWDLGSELVYRFMMAVRRKVK